MVPCVPVFPWEHLTTARSTPWFMHHMAVVVWASRGITWIHLSKDVLGAQTGQGKLHTIPLLTVNAIYAQINREENISFFFSQALEGVRGKSLLFQLLCLELPAPGMGRQVGKGMMPRSVFAPVPAPHQLSKKVCSRKEKKEKQNPQPNFFICSWSEARFCSRTFFGENGAVVFWPALVEWPLPGHQWGMAGPGLGH